MVSVHQTPPFRLLGVAMRWMAPAQHCLARLQTRSICFGDQDRNFEQVHQTSTGLCLEQTAPDLFLRQLLYNGLQRNTRGRTRKDESVY
jgi:hypothetical protein